MKFLNLFKCSKKPTCIHSYKDSHTSVKKRGSQENRCDFIYTTTYKVCIHCSHVTTTVDVTTTVYDYIDNDKSLTEKEKDKKRFYHDLWMSR